MSFSLSSFLIVLLSLSTRAVLASHRHIYWVSDIHLDNHYHTGAPDRCLIFGKLGTRCCRPIYDIPLPSSHPASMWGDYHCDSPEKLVSYVFNVSSNLFSAFPPSLIIQTGDLVDHHDILQDFSHNMREVFRASSYLKSFAYHGNCGLVMTIGNHDTWPVDQLGIPSNGSTKLTRTLWDMWQSFIPPNQKSDFLEGGYYVYTVSSSLRLIVLNSLYDDNHNVLISKGKGNDPGEQDSWLELQLKDARANGYKVWLIGHIPPNTGEADEVYQTFLFNLSSSYRDVIKAQLFGHTHTDSFFVYTDDTGPFSFALVNPSIVPDLHDPSIRILTFDDQTGDIIDYHQFYLNLTSLIHKGKGEMVHSYSFKEEYGVNNISSLDLFSLAKQIESDEKKAKVFSRNFYVSDEVGVTPSCDESCISSIVSSLVFSSS